MRRFFIVALGAIFASTLFVGMGFAQDLKIGFVDLQMVTAKSTRAQAQKKLLDEMLGKKKEVIEKMQKELISLKEQYDKQAGMLKEETRTAKEEEMGVKELKMKLAQKQAQVELQNKWQEAQKNFREEISKVIGKVREQKKLLFILDSAALLSADDAINVTEDVVKAYDALPASAPKPAGPPPTPAPKAPGKKK